jgi:SAM-dependent methyltransferase
VLEANVRRLMSELSERDRVLDVGGWACPFNRAQWILDAEPYETRGYYATFGGLRFQGPDVEWFTKQTWVQRDICDRAPWPFPDRFFDVAVCSHTLEDIRDPLWVCSELVRVARRGYIEVPSRASESALGAERSGQAGLSHHRWLIDIDGHRIRFFPKYHMIHADWRFHLPARFRRRLTREASVQWLWWDDTFEFEEVTIHGIGAQEAELERFAREVFPRPEWMYRLDRLTRRVRGFHRRAVSWVVRRLDHARAA